MPQPPQLFMSLTVGIHAPSQHVVPAVHDGLAPQRQAPSTHISLPVHAGLHGGTEHAPATHSSPIAHARLHAPQSVAVVIRSTHVPPQQV
jgi:hypothetical protein